MLKDYFIYVVIIFVIVFTIGGLGGCTRPEHAKKVLLQSGYTNIEITGWRPFMGDKGDYFSTGFRAKAVNGDMVSGAVTEGLIFKGTTVRLD